MKRRQRREQLARRQAHGRGSGSRPVNVMSRAQYEPVKKGHIVPQVYQRNFAVSDQVAVHIDGAPACVIMNIRDAGTRPRFYRRTRPDGTEIDDIEASLSYIEDAIRPVFDELIAGAPLDQAKKGVLAQFLGVQMVRGPAFFDERTNLLTPLLSGLSEQDLTPRALREAGGNVDVARRRVTDAYLHSTQQLTTMLTTATKMASVIGSMRWQLLQFDGPVLAFSDHPVVVWPWDAWTILVPFAAPQLGPLGSFEVRAPLAPDLAVLMTWVDEPDRAGRVRAREEAAEEINAFVVAQADRQWMHRIGAKPPIGQGPFKPLARIFETGYSRRTVEHSARRQFASRYLLRVRGKKFVSEIEMARIGT